MTGLEKIIGEIRSESDSAISEILGAANKEAEKIKAEAEETAARDSARLKRESEHRLSDQMSRAGSAAQLTRRQMLLAEKQKLIGETIEKAKQTVLTMPDAEYFAMILRLVKKNALPQKGEILFNEKDKNRAPASFADQVNQAAGEVGGALAISGETRKIDGGFVLVYEGIEQNCSISSIFDANIEMLQDRMKTLLFEE